MNTIKFTWAILIDDSKLHPSSYWINPIELVILPASEVKESKHFPLF